MTLLAHFFEKNLLRERASFTTSSVLQIKTAMYIGILNTPVDINARGTPISHMVPQSKIIANRVSPPGRHGRPSWKMENRRPSASENYTTNAAGFSSVKDIRPFRRQNGGTGRQAIRKTGASRRCRSSMCSAPNVWHGTRHRPRASH